MNEDSVKDYIEQCQSLIDASPQMDEQNTRTRLIDPFVRDVLGWDLYSTDIELEYSVQMGSTKKKVDYALLVDGAPVAFVEAKGCDTSIEGYDGQLGSYMKQEWVDWGLLTNGKRFKVFKLRKEANSPTVNLLGQATLETLESTHWMIEALSKEHIISGKSDSIYEHVERRKQAIETLSNNKSELAEDIRQVVINSAGDVVSQPVESLSKAFIDELVEALEEQSGRIPDSEPPTPQETEEDYLVIISMNGDEAKLTGNSQTELMGETVGYLIQNHGLIDQLPNFPYVPGEKYAILNDEPNHPGGEEMRLYQETGDGYFVYTALNKGDKKRYLTQFAQFCGLGIKFEGGW